MKQLPILLVVCLLLAWRTQLIFADADTAVPEAGVTRPSYYRNDYFGFSLLFPGSWSVVQQRKPHQFQAEGGDILVRDRVLKRSQVNADQRNTHNLLAITDASHEKNGWSPQIVIAAEGIHPGAPFKTANEYLAHTIKCFDGIRSPKTIVVTPPREVKLGEREFSRADFARGNVRQSYYATISEDFALSIIVSAGDAEQLSEANHVLENVHFTPNK